MLVNLFYTNIIMVTFICCIYYTSTIGYIKSKTHYFWKKIMCFFTIFNYFLDIHILKLQRKNASLITYKDLGYENAQLHKQFVKGVVEVPFFPYTLFQVGVGTLIALTLFFYPFPLACSDGKEIYESKHLVLLNR